MVVLFPVLALGIVGRQTAPPCPAPHTVVELAQQP